MRWYVGTTAVLGLSITLLLLVSGLFAGMQSETQERVGDFYTADVRVTPRGLSAIPPGHFHDLDATVQALQSAGADTVTHMEAQAILSRRSLEDALQNEDEQYQVGAPGSDADGDEVVGLGVLVGMTTSARDRASIQPHMVSGGLPGKGQGEGSVPIVMSLDRLEQFLTDVELARMTDWPPPLADLNDITFQVTSAVVVQNENGETEDVIRRPAHVAGLYDSGVEVLDSFTFLAPIEDVRQLLGHGPQDPIANVVLAHTNDEAAIFDAASRNGWAAQNDAAFTDRYLGQLIDVLKVLSLLSSAFLFMLPAFLIVHGVGRQLETHNREIAVCHAIGVRPRMVRRALTWVVVQVMVAAILLAAILTATIGSLLHWLLPKQSGLPLPMDFSSDLLMIVLAVGVTVVSVLIALFIAFRSQARQQLASTLRTF